MKWTSKSIEAVKAEVRQEILVILEREGDKAARAHLLAAIYALGQDEDAGSQQRLLISVYNALSLHSRYGGLSDADVARLCELAYSLLQRAGIAPFKSRLSSLYGELHLIKGKIYSRDGKFWAAAWESQIAYETAGRLPPGGQAFQLLTMGLRCLRLGHCTLGQRYLREAEDHGLSAADFEIGRINQIRALRLMGKSEEMRSLIRETDVREDLSPELRRELAWELLSEAVTASGDILPLIKAVRRGNSHYYTSYILEAFFWAHALADVRWQKEFPSISALARRVQIDVKKDPTTYRIACIFEQCKDPEIPLLLRLNKVEALIQEIKGLEKIDKQILCWLGICRWLIQHKSLRLAHLVLDEYVAICLKISRGRTVDVLGVARDILEEPWFESPA